MISPMPCKAPMSHCSIPRSPYTPGEITGQQPSVARQAWCDRDEEEAISELHDVMSGKTTPKARPNMSAYGARSLSAASTCATSPPPRSGAVSRSEWPSPELSSPECAFLALSEWYGGRESPSNEQHPQCPPGALDSKSSWLQARKVFVGGIPQNVDQNGLYQMFSKMGKVKKAWLQMHHVERGANPQPATKAHRGFGFVIFYDQEVLDRLLGDEDSRLVSFANDMKLDVKRAFDKKGLPSPQDAPPTGKSRKQSKPSLPPSPAPPSPAPQTCQGALRLPSSTSATSKSQACQSGSRMPPQGPQPQLAMAFPRLPAFPFQPGMMPQKPVDRQALALALYQAMPDYYED